MAEDSQPELVARHAMTEEHSAPGGPLTPSGLKPRQGKTVRLLCGCSHDDTRWLTYCAHVAEQVRVWRIAARTRRQELDPLLT